MSLHLFGFYFSLLLAAASCAYASDQDRPARIDSSGAAAGALNEGVAGRITDDRRAPVAGATVLAAALDANAPAVPEIAIVSDADGRYEWPLRAGRYELTVVAEGYQRTARRITVISGEVAMLDFRLTPRR